MKHRWTSASRGRTATAAGIAASIVALVALVLVIHTAQADKHRKAAAPGGGADAGQPALLASKGKKGKRGGRGHQKRKKRKTAKLETPNVVMVMTDDQAPSTMNPVAMPNLFTRIAPRGTHFTDYISSSPLCCPARLGFMTGQYGHNNGVLKNFYPDLIDKRNVLPEWLRAAGYSTAHVGKYPNAYEQGHLGPAAVGPGWDYWFTQMEKRRYYRWRASKNGVVRHFGTRDKAHLTTVTNDFAARWASKLARKRAPFYLQVDYYAPHTGAGRDPSCRSSSVPEPADEGRFATAPLPEPPNFNQADVSRMPDHVRNRPPLTSEEIEDITRRYRCSLESVYGIDRGLGMIMDAIEKRDELNQTVFIFTTDNGFFFGEHRIPKGKPNAYEENLRTPMFMRIPARYRDRAELVPESGASVMNVDLAPTILDLAKAEPCRRPGKCRRMDGRSLMPLMDGSGRFPSPRPVEVRLNDCNYRGVRWDQKIYLAYFRETATGCEQYTAEMYDLRADPYQLENLLPAETPAAAELEQAMIAKMNRLQGCSGIRGRDDRLDDVPFCK